MTAEHVDQPLDFELARLTEIYAFLGSCDLEVLIFRDDDLTYRVFSPTFPEMVVCAANEFHAHSQYARQLRWLIALGEASSEVRAASGESRVLLALLQGYEYALQIAKTTGDGLPD